MRNIYIFLFMLAAMLSQAQFSTLAIQDFDTLQTPALNYSVSAGNLTFASGNSPSTASPPNSPHGINGSNAWMQEGQGGGVTLVFDNVLAPAYDTLFVTFKLAAFANTGSNGLDALDYVTTAISINNGQNWYDQVRVNGAGNSSWPYTAPGIAERVFSTAAVTTFQPAATGPSPDGISTVRIKVPNTSGQVRVKITSRSSMAVERYCVDNVQVMVRVQQVDAGLEAFVNLPDTACGGAQDVQVTLKNHGPVPLSTATINWKVNNVAQPAFNWTGNLGVNQTANVTLGNYTFNPGTLYTIMAYTSNPNSVNDTVNGNDTIVKTGIFIKPTPGFTLTSSAQTVCAGDSVAITGTLTGTAPWSMVISGGAAPVNLNNITTPSFSYWVKPLSNTTYSVSSVSDAGACVNNSVHTMAVTVTTGPPASITPYGSLSFCMGDSVVLMANASASYFYQWRRNGLDIPGETQFVYTARQSGAYTVAVSEAVGCATISAPVNVTSYLLPDVFLGNDTNIAPGMTIILNAGTGYSSYLWSTGQTSHSIMLDSSGTGLGSVYVWVIVEDIYGCKGGDTIKVTFVHNPGMEIALNQSKVLVYPNPANEILYVKTVGFPHQKMVLTIMNLQGQKLFEQEFIPKNLLEIDTETLPSGVFFLTISGDDFRLSEKLLKN